MWGVCIVACVSIWSAIFLSLSASVLVTSLWGMAGMVWAFALAVVLTT